MVDLEAGKATAQLGKALAAAKAVGIQLVDAGGLDDEDGAEDRVAEDRPRDGAYGA